MVRDTSELSKWLMRHGLTLPDLSSWNIQSNLAGLSIPVYSVTGKLVFVQKKPFFGRDYDFEPAGCRRGAILYGLHRAFKDVYAQRRMVIVEGFSDTIVCHKQGLTCATGLLGSTIAPLQASVASCLADTVVYLLDGDDAGKDAALHAHRYTTSSSLAIGVCIEGHDPGELMAKNLNISKYVETAISMAPFMSFLLLDELGAVIQGIQR